MENRNYFSFCKPLIKECFKMYWYIPALSFVLYFFVGIFPILSNLSETMPLQEHVWTSLKNLRLVYMLLMCVVPIGTAIIMMGFLHKSSKALMLHVQPLSKNRIFNSYYISGLALCVIPILLMTVLYALVIPKVETVGFGAVANWMLVSIVVITFFYGITVLIGSLTGNSTMNFLMTGAMLLVIPIILVIINTYGQTFIVGYYEMPQWVLLAVNSNPILAMMFYYEGIKSKACVLYLLIGIIASALARLIYKTRKLELIGNSMLSETFEEVCTYLFAFVGMSIFGLLTWAFSSSIVLTVLAMIVGTLFAFAIVKIIMNRSIKIVNKKLIRSLLIYFAMATVFVAVVVFDITGMTSRVPVANEIESVEITNIVSGYEETSLGFSGSIPEEFGDINPVLSSPESIELALKLHNYILENKIYTDIYQDSTYSDVALYDVFGSEAYVGSEFINLRYNLKNGQHINRSYEIILDDQVIQLIEDLLTCEEYKENRKITSCIDLEKISHIEIAGVNDSYEEYYDEHYDTENQYALNSGSMAVIENPAMIKKILTAWDEDMNKWGYKENNRSLTPYDELAYIDIIFKIEKAGSSKKKESNAEAREYALTVYITEIDEYTIDCLVKSGYGQTVGVK